MAFDNISITRSTQEKIEKHLAYQNELLEHIAFNLSAPDAYKKLVDLHHDDCYICNRTRGIVK